MARASCPLFPAMHRVDKQASLEQAIRRSRQARAAVRRRRRRAAAFVALVALALTGSGLWTIGALTGADVVEAAVAKAQSLADLIGARSPGARSAGELIKTKHSRALAKARPAPRAGVERRSAAPKIAMAQIAQLLEAPPLVPAAVDFQQPAPLAELGVPPPTLSGIVLPGSGPGNPPGGSPPATLPGSEPKEPVLVPSAVPEPGTWATMLLGFGMIGWHLRRRTRIGVPAKN